MDGLQPAADPRLGRIFATVAAVAGAVRPGRRDLVVLIARRPGNGLSVLGVLERLADAVLVDLEGRHFDGLIADKAFDVNWIIEELEGRGAEIVISQHPNRTAPRNIDTEAYKWRHLIENLFGKLKEFKRIAMRACKKPTRAFQQ